MSLIITPKQCTKCKQFHPPTSEYFTSDKQKPDGLCSWCKSCRRESKSNRARIVESQMRDLLKRDPDYALKYHAKTGGLKECCQCGEWSLATKDYFLEHLQKPDGLRPECKLCTKISTSIFKAENTEWVSASNRARYRARLERDPIAMRESQKQEREKRKAYLNTYLLKYYHDHKETDSNKINARKAVRQAVMDEALPAITTCKCQECGKQAQHYHHWSYLPEHWLDVIAVCAECHKKIHANNPNLE